MRRFCRLKRVISQRALNWRDWLIWDLVLLIHNGSKFLPLIIHGCLYSRVLVNFRIAFILGIYLLCWSILIVWVDGWCSVCNELLYLFSTVVPWDQVWSIRSHPMRTLSRISAYSSLVKVCEVAICVRIVKRIFLGRSFYGKALSRRSRIKTVESLWLDLVLFLWWICSKRLGWWLECSLDCSAKRSIVRVIWKD